MIDHRHAGFEIWIADTQGTREWNACERSGDEMRVIEREFPSRTDNASPHELSRNADPLMRHTREEQACGESPI
jgi:hypothetical protein